MPILLQAGVDIDKGTVELLVNASSVTLAFLFGLALVVSAISLIRFLGSRGKGNEEALQTMSTSFTKSQGRIDELEQKLSELKTKEAERAIQWLEVVKNNTESQKQFAEAMNVFAQKNSEWRKEQVDLQKTTIDKLDALNLNFITWPKSATETAKVMADELKKLREEIEALPEELVEALRPVLQEFMDAAVAKFKSETALDSSTPLDQK